MTLLCERPHAKDVDFRAGRFIVGKACGMKLGTRRLEMGDELPQGALPEAALRELYEPPTALIELVEHAVRDPGLLAASLRRARENASVEPVEPAPLNGARERRARR